MENRSFYNEILTEHNLHPEFKHDLPDADIVLEGVNPSCGDDIFLKLKLDGDTIADGAFVGDGCAISQASADIMLGMIVGRKKDEALKLGETFLKMIQGEATEEEIDSLEEALRRAADNGVKRLIVQPTHIMDGFEYTALADKVAEYSRFFEAAAVGKPLLSSEGDFQAVVQALIEETEEYDDGETAFCFMGHGTEAQANQVYRKLQEMFLAAGQENYFIGTVEAEPALEEVLAQVKKGSYKRAVLQPLMIVAGDHANNDMAGEEEGYWKQAFEEAGYEVSCILRGLGELEKIRQLFVKHAKEAESCLLAV